MYFSSASGNMLMISNKGLFIPGFIFERYTCDDDDDDDEEEEGKETEVKFEFPDECDDIKGK
jgi:hypothetical protein